MVERTVQPPLLRGYHLTTRKLRALQRKQGPCGEFRVQTHAAPNKNGSLRKRLRPRTRTPGPALNDDSLHELQYQKDQQDYPQHGYELAHGIPRHPHPSSRPRPHAACKVTSVAKGARATPGRMRPARPTRCDASVMQAAGHSLHVLPAGTCAKRVESARRLSAIGKGRGKE